MPRFIVVVAPHTSNWDFIVGVGGLFALDIDAHWFGKESLFHGPLGWMMRRLGGRPVRRDTPDGVVAEMAAAVRAEPKFLLALAPEGTRRQVDEWRTGFYHIARAADVPVVPVWFDWSRRVIGVHAPLRMTGALDADLRQLRALYHPAMARNPAGFWRDAPRDAPPGLP